MPRAPLRFLVLEGDPALRRLYEEAERGRAARPRPHIEVLHRTADAWIGLELIDATSQARPFAVAFVGAHSGRGHEGLAAAAAIRTAEPALPIVLVTDPGDEDVRDAARRLRPGGPLHHLKTPVTPAELREAASSLARGWRRERRREAALAELKTRYRALAIRDQQIEAQKRRLDAALANTASGLLMLDAEHRIVLVNDRFLEFYGLEREIVQPGVTAEDIIDQSVAVGRFTPERGALAWQRWRERLASPVGGTYEQRLDSGRTITSTYTPMPEGGWVITYDDITEQVTVRAALEEQNRRFDAALASMPNGLCMFDAEHRLIVSNERYRALYGIDEGTVRPGMTFRAIVEAGVSLGVHGARTADEIVEERLAMVRGERPPALEQRLADGRTIEITYCPAPNGGWVTSYVDVTERRRSDEAIAEQNRLFDAALTNMAQGLLMLDGELRLIVCNQRYRDIFGLPPEATTPGASLRAIIETGVALGRHPGQTADQLYSARRALFERGEPALLRTPLADGRIIETAYRPMPGGGWVATYDDITERERTEEAIRLQNERFDAALENMTQGLCMFDGGMRLIVCNHRYAEMFGLDPALTKPGTTLREILEHRVRVGQYAGDDPDAYIAERLRVAAAGQPIRSDLPMQDGRVLALAHQPLPGGGWVATFEDITGRKQAEAQIAHMARHDALTNLPNRTLLRETLVAALTGIEASTTPLAVMGLDLDHFKIVNDTLGHPIGDALLRQAVGRIQSVLGPDDLVARLGGDEFAILQPSAEQPAAAGAVGQRLVEIMAEPFRIEGHELNVGLSVGIALAPADGTDPDTLLKNADLALYRAKAEGRNTFRFFEPAMDAQVQARRALELDLRRAFASGEFELFYQPLVTAADGRLSGFEALLRWHHPNRGLVSPTEFVPIAEEIGLIVPLGEWVIRQACLEAARWPGEVRVAVNLSPAQFRSRTLAQAVVSALAAARLSPRRLEIEITENVLLAENEATLATLHQLRALGVRISMDDFGTGYSSLSYLRSFPFDKIKIDRSFVRDLDERPDCMAIVRAIASLGSSLGIATTAEGVETEAQLAQVRNEGCTEIQGYLISPPRPARELGPLFAAVNAERSAA